MRLDYNVLWIDDQPRHVQSFRERIEFHLSEQGFALEVIQVASIDQAHERLGTNGGMDGVDLILVDYDLGPGNGGEEVLRLVRDRFPYKDVIFYSAEDIPTLRRLAHEANIDGIHFSTRFNLATDTNALIDKTLAKVLDIDHMRGVVMAATSDIDLTIDKIIRRTHEKLPAEKQKSHVSELADRLRRKLAEWTAELEKAESKGFEAILKLRHICTAAIRLELAMDEMERAASGKNEQLDDAKTYRDNVVPRRNKLAHLSVTTVAGQRVLAGAAETIDTESMTTLRCDLLKHRKNFEHIAVLLDVVDIEGMRA